MAFSTPSANSSTTAGRASLAMGAGGPAETWWTRKPGSMSTTAGRSSAHARVNTSHATPARASAEESSRT